jgi:hypothetical protein
MAKQEHENTGLRHRGRKRWRVLGVTVMVLAAGLSVVPDLVAFVAGADCASWREREVSGKGVYARELEEVSTGVVEVDLPWLPGGFSGMALPGMVAYAEKPDVGLWVHEMVHQKQMEDNGTLRYTALYTWDWLQGRYRGCSVIESYRLVRFELQAKRVSRSIPWEIRSAYYRDGGSGFSDKLRAGEYNLVALGGSDGFFTRVLLEVQRRMQRLARATEQTVDAFPPVTGGAERSTP